jgi:SnoaL-like polyketide cyclase
MNVEKNMELMQTLDDAWNNQDWETFNIRHTEDTAVYWPGQPEPTRGRHDHRAEAIEFFKTFPDNHIDNHPYKVLFGHGDWTCSIARFTGTMKGPMKGPDGKESPPMNKSFEIEFLHGRALEGRRDRRREILLRSGRIDETNRSDVRKPTLI